MAIEKEIRITADVKDAEKGIDKIADSLEQVDENAQQAEDAIDDVGKKAKQQSKAVKGLGSAVRGVGIALKALGIGLIIALVAKLTDTFSRNQKVVDFFSTAMETLGLVFNQISDAVISTYKAVAKSSENFNALGAVIKGLLTLAITPLKLSFFAIKLAIQEAQLIWEKSFFGDKDPKTIKELNQAISKTVQDIEDTAITAAAAGATIIKNFGEAVTEVANIGSVAVENLSKVSLKAAYEQAQVNVQLKNTAELAAAQQGRLVEQFDRLAEQQRQIRDDESKSIEVRKQANEELGRVLEQQEKAMLAQAGAQVAAAQAQLDVIDNIENQVALTEALANQEGVLAQVEGFRSEQLVNKIALQKEEIELNQTISDAEKERQLAQLEFDASREQNDIIRLEKQREILEQENEIILEDLERKKELYAEGTQARVDAEQDFLNRKQEIDNEIVKNEDDLNKAKIKLSDEETKAKEENTEKTKQVLSGFAALAGETTAVGKSLSIATATIDTFRGVGDALAAKTVTPFETALKFANAAAIAAAGFANVKNILSVKIPSVAGSSASVTGGGGEGTKAPSFNLVQGTGSNQVAESIQSQDEPIQAFVVSSNVTSSQELDRNIIDNASI